MSDTPRTDAAWKPDGGDYFIVDVDLARQLERELNTANDRIKRLEEELNELRSDEARLLNLNGELERRIKRLEEAGDAMINEEYNKPRHVEQWRKAKEAKP